MGKKDEAAAAPAAPTAAELEAAENERVANAAIAAELKRHETSTARPDMAEFLTDAEKAVRDETQRLIAAGQDPFGDDEPLVRTEEEAADINAADAALAAAAAAADPDAAAEGADDTDGVQPGDGAVATDEGAPVNTDGMTPEQIATAQAAADAAADTARQAAEAAAAAANDAEPNLEVPVTLVPVVDPKTLADAREAAEAAVDAIETKYAKNELTDEERVAQVAVARRTLNGAIRAEAGNDAKLEMNQANARTSQEAVFDKLRTIGKEEGINYLDDKNAKRFDQALTMVLGDADNKGLSFGKAAYKAHVIVRAMAGVVPKPAPAPAPAPKPAAGAPAAPAAPAQRAAPKPPVTLRNVPAAAGANPGGAGALEVGAQLRGQAYEAWFAAQPASVRRQLLDS